MSFALVLNPARPSAFRRTIRDESGAVVRLAVFEPREPVILSDDEFIAMADDVGHAVLYAAVDDSGKPLSKPAIDQGEPADIKPKRKKK